MKGLAEIILLGCMWGPSFLFIKLGVAELCPFALVAGRVGVGALLLYIVLKCKRLSLPRDPKVWGQLLIMGFFAASLPFILFAFAEQKISSALAGLINGSTPIFAALLAHFFLADERLTWRRLGGVACGLAGFLILVLGGDVEGNTLSVVLVAIASISYAVGMVYTKKYLKDLPPYVGPTAMLIGSAAYLVPLAIIAEPFYGHSHFNLQAIGSIVGLAALGTAAAFFFYYRVIARSGAVALSMSVYLMSLVAAALGYWLLGEHLQWTVYVAAVLIVVGLVIVNQVFSIKKT